MVLFSSKRHLLRFRTGALLVGIIMISMMMPFVKAAESTSEDTLRALYIAYDTHDWDTYLSLTSKRDRKSEAAFVSQYSDTYVGIFNIAAVKLRELTKLDRDRSQAEFSAYANGDFYYGSQLEEGSSDENWKENIICFLSLADFKCYEPDEFLRNGPDYRVDTLVKEDGEWHLAFSARPEPALLEEVYGEVLPPEAVRYIELYNLKQRTGFTAGWEGEILAVNSASLSALEIFSRDADRWKAFQFSDVDKSERAIRSCVEYGLMEGCGGGLFQPDAPLTFAQAVKLAATLHSMVQCVDIPEAGDPWYAPYWSYARENKLLEQIEDKDPEEPITLSQASILLTRALPSECLPLLNPDVHVEGAIGLLFQAGILNPIAAEKLQPNAVLTRRFAAALCVNLVDPFSRIFVLTNT